MKLDWNDVAKKNENTEWKILPAQAQHRNGLPEAMIKQIKK